MPAALAEKHLGWYKDLDLAYEKAEERVRAELQKEGFGILSEIRVHEKLKEKLGVTDFPKFTVLGACNPQLANVALRQERDVGLLLPCNVTLEDVGGGRTRVAIVKPRALVDPFTENIIVCGVADDATERLRRVAEAL
ncbi:MAG TPA: DUF302 domain-containing protein [Candidatus Thermoplasmatota archaeon]|nr:DUF302 domain-containing protein [Candidatus Thermoplasmatota archaeon]